MKESIESMDNLDALINEALSEEPFRKAPLSLHRSIEARVRLVSLHEQEQKRFAVSMASLVLILVTGLSAAGVLVWFTTLSFLFNEGVSGGRGHVDYYATSLNMFLNSYQGAYSLLASFVLAAGAVALALLRQVHKFIHQE